MVGTRLAQGAMASKCENLVSVKIRTKSLICLIKSISLHPLMCHTFAIYVFLGCHEPKGARGGEQADSKTGA